MFKKRYPKSLTEEEKLDYKRRYLKAYKAISDAVCFINEHQTDPEGPILNPLSEILLNGLDWKDGE